MLEKPISINTWKNKIIFNPLIFTKNDIFSVNYYEKLTLNSIIKKKKFLFIHKYIINYKNILVSLIKKEKLLLYI